MKKELKETIEAYDKSAEDYSNTIAKLQNYNQTYEYFLSIINNESEILDLACGPANISKRVLQKFDRVRINGIDLSVEMIAIAKKELPKANFLVGDILDFRIQIPVDAVILGFAIPYLDLIETEQVISNTALNLKENGKLYLSFMHGNTEGYESPSFNKNVKVYIYYHDKRRILSLLRHYGFKILKTWEIDYNELDGSITTDVVIIGEKVK